MCDAQGHALGSVCRVRASVANGHAAYECAGWLWVGGCGGAPIRGQSRLGPTVVLSSASAAIAPYIINRDHLQQRDVNRSGNHGSKSTHDHRRAHSQARALGVGSAGRAHRPC